MATERWNIDTTHSNVDFIARHLVVTKVRGTFGKWSGHLDLDADDLTRSSASATFEIASIDTREPQRDGHLKSPDFFDAEKYPQMTFASTNLRGGGDAYELTGDLTIHGTTKTVTLEVEAQGKHKDPWGNTRIAFSARGRINRKDFGLGWNQVLETGGLLVSEKIEIEIEIQAVKAV